LIAATQRSGRSESCRRNASGAFLPAAAGFGWPAGGIPEGARCDGLIARIHVFPTLAEAGCLTGFRGRRPTGEFTRHQPTGGGCPHAQSYRQPLAGKVLKNREPRTVECAKMTLDE